MAFQPGQFGAGDGAVTDHDRYEQATGADDAGAPEAPSEGPIDHAGMVAAAIAARRGEIDDQARQQHQYLDAQERDQDEYVRALQWRYLDPNKARELSVDDIAYIYGQYRAYLSDMEKAEDLKDQAEIANTASDDVNAALEQLNGAFDENEGNFNEDEVAIAARALQNGLGELGALDTDTSDRFEEARKAVVKGIADLLDMMCNALLDRSSDFRDEADDLVKKWPGSNNL